MIFSFFSFSLFIRSNFNCYCGCISVPVKYLYNLVELSNNCRIDALLALSHELTTE